jgi:hypothetical protein
LERNSIGALYYTDVSYLMLLDHLRDLERLWAFFFRKENHRTGYLGDIRLEIVGLNEVSRLGHNHLCRLMRLSLRVNRKIDMSKGKGGLALCGAL